jgi:hypothetical protein
MPQELPGVWKRVLNIIMHPVQSARLRYKQNQSSTTAQIQGVHRFSPSPPLSSSEDWQGPSAPKETNIQECRVSHKFISPLVLMLTKSTADVVEQNQNAVQEYVEHRKDVTFAKHSQSGAIWNNLVPTRP